MKLAMVLAISRKDTLLIEHVDMLNAIALFKRSLSTLENVFRGCGESNLAVATGYVKDFLEKNGSGTRKAMLSRLHQHMDTDTLDKILYVLTEIGYCRKSTIGSTPMYVVMNGTGAMAPRTPAKAGNGAAKGVVIP
jgi:hypothetical protein